MHERLQSIGWMVLLTVVIAWFFHETLLQGFSLVPTDMLHQLVLPYGESVSHVAVQNHYTMDIIEQDYPWAMFWQQSVRNGQVPLWNPFIYGGQPHLATSMAGVFSPFRLLLLWLTTERALSLGIVLEFVLAGVFMFALLRELGRSHCASFVGSCAFALNSALLMWYWRLPVVFVWVPLVLLLFERAKAKDSWPHTLAAGLVLGVTFLSANVQSSFHVAFLIAGYGILTLPWREAQHRNVELVRLSVLLFVGTLVAAVQFLPTLELMAHDVSKRVQFAGPRPSLSHSLIGIVSCITFVFPGLAGSTESYDLLKATGASMGSFTGYIGIVPFTMFLVGAFGVRERRVRAFLIMIALVMGIIFFTPLLKYVYHRFFIVAVFGAAIIAAYGTDFVLEETHKHSERIRRVFVWMCLVCLTLGLGLILTQIVVHARYEKLSEAAQNYVAQHADQTFFGTSQSWLRDRVPLFLHHFRLSNVVFWLPICSVLLCAAGWIGYAQGRLRRSAFCTVLVILTVCDLTMLGRKTVPQVNLKQYPLYPSLPVLAEAQADSSLFRIQRWSPEKPIFLPDNILMVYGTSVPSGYESLRPENLSSLPYQTANRFNELLDLANVKYLLTDQSISLPPERFELRKEADGARLYLNKTCLPRLQFVPRWEVEPDRKKILARITAEPFDPKQVVFVESAPPMPAGDQRQSEPVAAISFKQYGLQRVLAKVHCAQAGFLVLADTFYPGWRARRNGQETMLYRADYVLKAVFLPAGESEVEFYYAPLSFRIGAAISSGTVILATIAGLWLALRRRSHT